MRITTPEDLRELMDEGFVLSAQQWAAVSAPLEPTVVMAGAGSGKTSLMAARVVYLVATGQVRPGEVLGLTFTTKAAGELGGRVRAGLIRAGLLAQGGAAGEDEVPEPTVATYNAYAASLLTEQGLRIGHEPDTRVLADASRFQLAGRVVDRYPGEVRSLSDHPDTVIANMMSLDGAMSEHLVTPDEVRAFDRGQRRLFADATSTVPVRKAIDVIDRRAELLGLVEAYRSAKVRLGLMDFSDQISRAAELVTAHPDVGGLERAKFAVVLLDEYQDTSVAQARLLSALFSGPERARGRGHAVTAVGDPNQAIYGWRGASVSNIVGFGVDFPSPDGSTRVPVLPLSVNRRSGARVLEVANRLAGPLYDGLRAAGVTAVEELRADPTKGQGEVEVVVHETDADELAWLAVEVRTAHDERLETRGPGGDEDQRPWQGIGVLVRDNAHAAEVYDVLTRAEVPVEIVGLQGLLRLPEVAEVLSTLRLLHDLTANADLLTVLTGPRWALGTRDLALLGRRARELSGGPGGGAGGGASGRHDARPDDLAEELSCAVEGSDPTEVAALVDALDDPGEHDYSAEARERFALLSGELRSLRSHAGEPLLDLVRRVIDLTGVDVELAASVNEAASARRDNLDLFVKTVAEFWAVDGDVTLPALLAYLTAEDDQGQGLDVSTPSEADSVKLLTVHRAKGLEWDVVFLVGACEKRFPHTTGRSLWPTSPAVLPAPLRGDAVDLPQLAGHDNKAIAAYQAAAKDHERAEELRLGYVAFTRARRRMVASSYLWSDRAKGAYGPSPYQEVAREVIGAWDGPCRWLDKPVAGDGSVNPCLARDRSLPWPLSEPSREALLRRGAAEVVRAAMVGRGLVAEVPEDELDVTELARVSEWDAEIEQLLAEAVADRATEVVVPLPSSLSATALARLRDDPEQLARDLARPMPRRPSPAARFGTRFHAWVETRFGQQQLLDLDEVPGRGDSGIEDDADLAELVEAFERGPFAERVPIAVEAPFALVLAGQVVRGRIDAVYADDQDEPGHSDHPGGAGRDTGGTPRFLVVDWKTGRQPADPLQLALYRLAWAELRGVPLDRVVAGFCYVRTGETQRHEDLPDRVALEALLDERLRPPGEDPAP